jgi:hypothetical protein
MAEANSPDCLETLRDLVHAKAFEDLPADKTIPIVLGNFMQGLSRMRLILASAWILWLGLASPWVPQLLGRHQRHPKPAEEQRSYCHRQLDRATLVKLGACV